MEYRWFRQIDLFWFDFEDKYEETLNRFQNQIMWTDISHSIKNLKINERLDYEEENWIVEGKLCIKSNALIFWTISKK
jgi:hypothetical protein